MTSKRLYYALVGLVCILVIGLVAGAYGVNKLLSQKSLDLANLKAKSRGLEQEQLSLAKAKKDLENYADLEKIAKAVVPQDKDQAQTTREIVKIAEANGVSLASITFPASSLGSNAKPGSGGGDGQSTSSKSSSSKAGLSQLQPVKNISGVYSLLITVQSDSSNPVPYNQFINFLNSLERNRRTAQVNTISITPDSDNRNLLSFTLTLNEYIKP